MSLRKRLSDTFIAAICTVISSTNPPCCIRIVSLSCVWTLNCVPLSGAFSILLAELCVIIKSSP
ncbi:hypothetical protein MBAV_003921 [Candidatus Magnetobacterium bavaricum]|uniref:Uncharacterized protein n=1 Tax=Candidatus Magnetobacterium bavaricum TaxID=29290 RepID=A0A0F3GPZ3_9BACT|nr:hypothetical protein MBAV_003921 [Candidatus Magnetobacterium bavaricum]